GPRIQDTSSRDLPAKFSTAGDRFQSLTGGGNYFQFTHDSMGRMTYDGLAGSLISYNRPSCVKR
ncbi:MAG: hypothetical protein II064_09205, partial [Bacteroidales bacterium]|nr:hypothetical protein [Bacteroidales bacterium]